MSEGTVMKMHDMYSMPKHGCKYQIWIFNIKVTGVFTFNSLFNYFESSGTLKREVIDYSRVSKWKEWNGF